MTLFVSREVVNAPHFFLDLQRSYQDFQAQHDPKVSRAVKIVERAFQPRECEIGSIDHDKIAVTLSGRP